jgi:hypothetical protein
VGKGKLRRWKNAMAKLVRRAHTPGNGGEKGKRDDFLHIFCSISEA